MNYSKPKACDPHLELGNMAERIHFAQRHWEEIFQRKILNKEPELAQAFGRLLMRMENKNRVWVPINEITPHAVGNERYMQISQLVAKHLIYSRGYHGHQYATVTDMALFRMAKIAQSKPRLFVGPFENFITQNGLQTPLSAPKP